MSKDEFEFADVPHLFSAITGLVQEQLWHIEKIHPFKETLSLATEYYKEAATHLYQARRAFEKAHAFERLYGFEETP